jgi:pimeloyl-ACP methyl ester carboxylesterase
MLMPPLSHVRTELLDIAYFDVGRRDAPPVVLLHGWPDDPLTWTKIMPALEAAGLRCLVPYLRGYGPTRFLDPATPRSGQLAALGQDVIDFANALGLGSFCLVGHDWGARAAAIATAELQDTGRVRKLVLVSVGYGTNVPSQKMSLKQTQNYWYQWYMATSRGREHLMNERRDFTRYLWQVWSPGWQFPEEEFQATAASFDNPDWMDVVISSYRHRWGNAPGDPRYEALEKRLLPPPQVLVPTLQLHGAADAANDPETSAGKEGFFAASYERALLPGLGHFPQRERPHEVAARLAGFLAL